MTNLPPVLPLFLKLSPLWFCFGCGCLFFRQLAARSWIGKDWRISWALTVLLMGCLYVGIAECAGAARQLNRAAVLGAWMAVDAALLVAVVRMRAPAPKNIRAAIKDGWRRFSPPSAAGPLSRWNNALLVLAAAMVLLVGFIALWCPTNVWDSLTYHLPRVLHWLQQHSLAHYPTNSVRQLELSPGAELQTCSLMLLTGDDWPVNLPQWWALLTCALLASFLTEKFLTWHFGKTPLDAAKVRFCGLFAALLAITVPQAVTQAVSTQNDLLSSQWVMLLAAFSLLLAGEPRNRIYAAAVAAAFALGFCNKPTMVVYAAPFGLVLALWLWRKSLRTLLTLGLVTTVFALALNLPWMTRNYKVYHTLMGARLTRNLLVMENHAPAKWAANLIRNLALYSSTPFAPVTSALNHLAQGGFDLLGQPPQDPASVWLNTAFGPSDNAKIQNGDGFGGIITVLPPLLAAVFFLIKFKWKSPLALYPVLVFAGFALFSGYLKWQPWHQRLHLPYFILAAPFAGMVLGWVWNRWCVLGAALLLSANSLLVLWYNPSFPIHLLSDEPFKTREERYFCWRPDLYPCTAELARDLVASGVTNVLLKIGSDTWEYPLWVCLKNRGFQGTIQHAFVDDESAALGSPNLDLPGTAILCEDAAPPAPPDFGLTVGYDNWTVLYRGKPENRMKLISNRALIGLSARQPGRLEIRCDVLDQTGRPVTNNIIRLQTSASTRDYPLASAPLVLECPLKTGPNMMRISLLAPPTPEQRILTLANVTTKLEAP